MSYAHNDFRVFTYVDTARPTVELWKVTLGGNGANSTILTIAADEAEADRIAEELNKDPWYLDRGQTRAEMYGSSKTLPDDFMRGDQAFGGRLS